MNTKIIAVGNQKGGVGKSSTIHWLASTLSIHYDKKVAVIDGIDTQQTIAKRRSIEVSQGKEAFPYEVFFINHLSELDTVLDDYFGEFDMIFLDMPPLVKNEFKILLAGCDGLLIPMLADTVDKDSALDYMLYVNEIKRENEAYLCYGFINRFANSIKQKELPAFAESHGIELFESTVPAVPLVLSMNETYTSPYDKIGSNGKIGKHYLEAFVLEFIDKFLK
jgi:cellulose biosynthesis protein BcsQ